MADLIDRQAAIDAVVEFYEELVKRGQNGLMSWTGVKATLECLPSAQQEIIRCKDCKHRIVNEHYGQKGYIKLKAMCELDTGDYFELGRNAEDDDWFCADAERR